MSKPYWHIHHKTLLEWNTEPIKNRREYIKEYKPKHERALRLRLLKPVKGKLPAAVVKAGVAHAKAGAAHAKAGAAYVKAQGAHAKVWGAYDSAWYARDKARDTYVKAFHDHKEEIETLHAKECHNCPWDGETIFPIE
ncbi:MAG: hypothetical protein GY906_17990 [bacterium]|nr:hypothetical protein [bacterium]